MISTSRRTFLIGLFGTAAVAAAGPIPEIFNTVPEPVLKSAAQVILPAANEVYCNYATGEYCQATVKWLGEAPWFSVFVPPGFTPMRAESDRINSIVMEQLNKMKDQI